MGGVLVAVGEKKSAAGNEHWPAAMWIGSPQSIRSFLDAFVPHPSGLVCYKSQSFALGMVLIMSVATQMVCSGAARQ
jgi:hypothetical protein